MHLQQYFHLLLSLVFILYSQTQTSANGSNNNSTLNAKLRAETKNVTTKVSQPKEPLKSESSERSIMRDFGTKYELPIIFQSGNKSVPVKTSENTMKIIVNLTRDRFNGDGQKTHFRLPSDGDFNNDSNGFYSAKRGDSRRMSDSDRNSMNKNGGKHRRLMPPFAIDFKMPDTAKKGVQREAGCRCDCPNDPYQVHHRSYQEKGNDEERDVKIEVEFGDGGNNEGNTEEHFRMDNNEDDSDMAKLMEPDSGSVAKAGNPEDDYNNYANHDFGGKWKLKQPTADNQEFGNDNDNGSQQGDNDNSDQQEQQQQQPPQQRQQQRPKPGNSADTNRVAVECDFSKSNCNFENDHYDDSLFRYGYNVHFKDKMWYIDHFPQRRFPGPSGQRRNHGWGRLMSPVYDVPRDAGRDACMLLEFEFDSEGTDQLTVMLQESDHSRTILDYMHERPNEQDSLLLRKYVHFILSGSSIRFFIQFTFETKQQNSQYGVRNFEIYWSACPFSKQLTNPVPNQPLSIDFSQI